MSSRTFRIAVTIVCNIVFGSLILYYHEVYLRKQSAASVTSWFMIPLVAVCTLFLISFLLKKERSWIFAFLLSAVISYLIPVVGFSLMGEFGQIPGAMFIAGAYLWFGYLTFVMPMTLLNTLSFRWISTSK